MQRILKEAFDIDVSLPTISRILKMKGCTKGFNKTRQIRTATNVTLGHNQTNKSQSNESHAQASMILQDFEAGIIAAPTAPFENSFKRHLEQHLGQNSLDCVVSGASLLEHAMNTGFHKHQRTGSTEGQVHNTEHNPLTVVALKGRTASVDGNTNAVIDLASE